MDISTISKRIDHLWRPVYSIILALFIAFGLLTKLLISMSFQLNSDTVGAGLVSMEILKHHNYLLSGYHLPAADTLLFTEIIPFQLIPQVLTGYSPLTLKLVSFAIFTLSIIVLGYIVFTVSGSRICALVFAALAANVPPAGYEYFALPTTHNATVLFSGIVLIILLYLSKPSDGPVIKVGKNKIKRAERAIQWPYIIGLIVLVGLIVLSDSIILVWLIIPYVLAYILFFKEKTKALNIYIGAMVVIAGIAYLFKTYLIPDWSAQILRANSQSTVISVNLPLFFKALAQLLNQGLYQAMMGLNSLNYLDVISLIAFAAVAIYAIWNALKDKQKLPFYAMLLTSCIIIFLSFLVSDYVSDISSARYLTFTAFALLMILAMSYRETDKVYGALLLVVLVISAIYGYTYMNALDHKPNDQEYSLISYMNASGLTYGYGSYWDSSIISHTYREKK